MFLFKRSLKTYKVDIYFKKNSANPALHQVINVCARSKRQAIRAAKQLWEPYLTKYDMDWPKSKKELKYKIIGKWRIK